MASEGAGPKRANLVASRVDWSHVDLPEPIRAHNQQAHGIIFASTTGSMDRDGVREWLTTTVTEV
ncbi:hypothetical protein PAMP_011536 [Pampus punctatissimus]